MATYKYRENFYTNISGKYRSGWIKYNVTPDGGLFEDESYPYIGLNTTVTVSGQIYAPFNVKSIALCLTGDYDYMVAYANKTISTGGTVTFSLKWTVTQAFLNSLQEQNYDPELTFIIGSKTLSSIMSSSWVTQILGNGSSSYTGPEGESSTVSCYYSMVKTISAPVARTYYTDEASISALDVFGKYATNYSKPRIYVEWTYDQHHPDILFEITITTYGYISDTYVINPNKRVNSIYLDLPTPEVFSSSIYNLVYHVDVTQSDGQKSTVGSVVNLCNYHTPVVNTLKLERYKIEQTSTGSISVEADDGDHVWLNLHADISAIDNLNAWTSTMTYWKAQDDESTAQPVPNWSLSNSDGEEIQISRDENLFSGLTLADNYSWKTRLTITDALNNSISIVCDDIVKAGAVFDVEPNGVAVGMRSTATELEPKFECAFPTQFYDNVAVPVNGLMKVVTATGSVSLSTSNKGDAVIVNLSPGTGWTPIGIIGWNCSNTGTFLSRMYYNSSDSTARGYAYYQGTSSSAVSITITLYVLCIRTNL